MKHKGSWAQSSRPPRSPLRAPNQRRRRSLLSQSFSKPAHGPPLLVTAPVGSHPSKEVSYRWTLLSRQKGMTPRSSENGGALFVIVLPDTRTRFVLPCHVKMLLKMNGLWARGISAEVVFTNTGWKKFTKLFLLTIGHLLLRKGHFTRAVTIRHSSPDGQASFNQGGLLYLKVILTEKICYSKYLGVNWLTCEM